MKEIPLTHGQVALVDDEQYPILSQYRWMAHRNSTGRWYAIRHTYHSKGEPRKKWIFMHHAVLGIKALIDHSDGNGLNNQRDNLRLATPSQNAGNVRRARGVVPFKGVYCARRGGDRFVAKIRVDGKRISLGYYSSPEAAARAYDKAALHYFKDFAATNESLGLLPEEKN